MRLAGGLVILIGLLCCAAADARPRRERAEKGAQKAEGTFARARAKGALRGDPDAGAKVVGKVRARDRLEVLGRSPDGHWVQVRKKRTIGWIETEGLDGLPAAAAPPAAATGPTPVQVPATGPAPAAPTASGPRPPTPDDPFTAGNAHYERGEYDQAIARFEAGYRAQIDPVYLFNIAQAHRLAKRPAEALTFYRRYLEQTPAAANRAEVEGRIQELEQEAATTTIFRAAKEGRQLVKDGRVEEGLRRLREALRQGEASQLSDDERADLHYTLGLCLLRADRPEEAAAALRQAAALSPRDATIQLDLATALLRADEAAGAAAAAREALRLGLEGDDRRSAEDVLRRARGARLHDQLLLDASVAGAFDSNVLQGSRETIGGRFTGAATRKTAAGTTRTAAVRTLLQDIAQQYRTPAPVRAESDLPVSLYLDVGGRLAGGKRAQLWAEYHFSQTFMTLPQTATADDLATLPVGTPYDPYGDHDVYNLQEHRATVRLRSEPARWLLLGLRVEGFANFSGLRQFTPFQGGITGGLDGTFRETKKLQTRVTLTHQYRASFDRSITTYTNECGQVITDSDTYLDGNRTDLSLTQELRLPWLRGRLGYQLHSDRTGTLLLDTPYLVSAPANPDNDVVLGCYNYRAPLSYLGHEAVLSGRFLLPKGFELFGSARYEYRSYADLYGARFHPKRAGVNDTSLGFLPRRDHRIVAEVTARKDLPRGFAVEAGYSYTRNLSNIANGIDNRNYDKHVASLWALYSF